MRVFISALSLITACSSKQIGPGPTEIGTKSPIPKEDSISELKLVWSEITTVPAGFSPPISHASVSEPGKFLVIDKSGKSFLVDASQKLVFPLLLWPNLRSDSGTQVIVQTSEYSAWHLRSDKLQWIRWEANGTDYQKVEASLAELFSASKPESVSVRSPRVEDILLTSGDRHIHVWKQDNRLKVKRYSGLKKESLLSARSGHLFEYSQSKLGRLLELEPPVWTLQSVTHSGLPGVTSDLRMDVFGDQEALQLSGIAVAGGSFLMSAPTQIGTIRSTNTPKVSEEQDTEFSRTIEPFLLKHCGSCHEGRAPAFVRADGAQKKILKDVVLAQRDKIKFRIMLPQTDGRVMPPYAPFPVAEEIAAVIKWLE